MTDVEIPDRAGTFFDGEPSERLRLARCLDTAWKDYVIITRRMEAVWSRTGQSAREVEAATGIRPIRVVDLQRGLRLRQVMAWAAHFNALPSPMLRPVPGLESAFVAAPARRPSDPRIVSYRVAEQIDRRRHVLRMTLTDAADIVGVDMSIIASLLRRPGHGHGPMSSSVLDLLCITHGLSLALHENVSTQIRGEPHPRNGFTRTA